MNIKSSYYEFYVRRIDISWLGCVFLFFVVWCVFCWKSNMVKECFKFVFGILGYFNNR